MSRLHTKVTTLLQTPAADGLYHRGINMSGVIGPLLADQEGSGENLAEALMKEVNVTGIKELAEIPFAFHNINLVPMAKEAKNAEKIEEQFFESVISFARSGNPNHNILPLWSPSTEEEAGYTVRTKG